MQKGTLKDMPHQEQIGLGHGPTLHRHGLQDVQTRLFVSFRSLVSTFWETSHSTFFHCYSNGPGCGFGLPNHLGQGHCREGCSIQKGYAHGHENLSIAQHRNTLWYTHTLGGSYKPNVKHFDVGDFVYLQRQPNDILETSLSCIILKIKAIKPSSVLELQGADISTIRNHSTNYAPCHLSNLDPTIIMLIQILPLDYPCQVCQKIDDADQMLLCDNCNGGYHLFCLKLKFTQVPVNIWYYSSCSLVAP